MSACDSCVETVKVRNRNGTESVHLLQRVGKSSLGLLANMPVDEYSARLRTFRAGGDIGAMFGEAGYKTLSPGEVSAHVAYLSMEGVLDAEALGAEQPVTAFESFDNWDPRVKEAFAYSEPVNRQHLVLAA